MKMLTLLPALAISMSAVASPALVKQMDAIYAQMDPIRQSGDRKRLSSVRAQADQINSTAGAGRADTGCFDASGMLRAMSLNIEQQWDSATTDQAQRQQARWQELNAKYRQYAAQCSASKG